MKKIVILGVFNYIINLGGYIIFFLKFDNFLPVRSFTDKNFSQLIF